MVVAPTVEVIGNQSKVTNRKGLRIKVSALSIALSHRFGCAFRCHLSPKAEDPQISSTCQITKIEIIVAEEEELERQSWAHRGHSE